MKLYLRFSMLTCFALLARPILSDRLQKITPSHCVPIMPLAKIHAKKSSGVLQKLWLPFSCLVPGSALSVLGTPQRDTLSRGFSWNFFQTIQTARSFDGPPNSSNQQQMKLGITCKISHICPTQVVNATSSMQLWRRTLHRKIAFAATTAFISIVKFLRVFIIPICWSKFTPSVCSQYTL